MHMFEIIALSQTNCYLLRAGEGYLLIDCGSASDQRIFLSHLKRLGLKVSNIHYLFLTHHHNDHCGLLPFLVKENTNMKVIMSKKCSEYLKTGTHCQHDQERYANPLLAFVLKKYFMFQGYTENFVPYFLRETDIIIEHDLDLNPDNEHNFPDIGVKARILQTPGHTEDSISLVIDQVAFVGDAARNLLNFTGAPYLPLILFDLSQCHQSWNKLIDSRVKMIYPAHGKKFRAEKLQKYMV